MIQDIISGINNSIRDCFNIENSIYYGLTQTIEVNNERFPVTRNEEGKLIKVCLNDKVDLMVFHKVAGEVKTIVDKDKSFGRKYLEFDEVAMKVVFVLKSAINLISPTYNPISFKNAMPNSVLVEDYHNIIIQKNTVSTSHDSIVNREWKRIDYSKHKCKFFVFEVNYTIRALTCKLACTSFLLLEDGEYKVLQEDGSFILL